MFLKLEIYSRAAQPVDRGSVTFARTPPNPALFVCAGAFVAEPQSQASSCYLQVSYPFPSAPPCPPRSPCHQLSPSKSGCAVYPGSRRRDVSPRCDASHARRQNPPDAIHTCGISKSPPSTCTRTRTGKDTSGKKGAHKHTHTVAHRVLTVDETQLPGVIGCVHLNTAGHNNDDDSNQINQSLGVSRLPRNGRRRTSTKKQAALHSFTRCYCCCLCLGKYFAAR